MMNLRRKNIEPVEVEHVYRFDDGSTEVEVVHADTVAVPVDGDTAAAADNGGTAPAPDNASPTGERRRSLAALLTEAGIASEEQIHQALEEGQSTGEKLGEVVIRRGWASEARLAQLLAEQWGLRAVDPGALSLDPLAVARVEIAVAAELGGFPVWFDEQGIVVAVSEPNEKRFASFRELLGNVSFVVVPGSTLRELVESRLFGANGRGAGPEAAHGNDTLAAAAATADAFETVDEPSSGGLEPDVLGEEQPEESLVVAFDDALPTEQPWQSQVESAPIPAPAPGPLVERLRSIELEVQDLEQAVVDARATVEARDAELAAARQERAQALDRVRDLEAELVDRDARFRGLREKVADLSLALDD